MALTPKSFQDRCVGAIMGAFIGDALGVGPHWYYDRDQQVADYGDWISGYTNPKPGRYHEGVKAGEPSQAGVLLELTLRSLVESGGYDEGDWCRRMDEEFLPKLDGKPMSGPGGYSNQSIRETWRRRVEQKLPWGQTADHADTTECVERTLAIAVRYALQPRKMAEGVLGNSRLTQSDEIVQSIAVAYGALLAHLIQGVPFDSEISWKLMEPVKTGDLPFHVVTTGKAEPPKAGSADPPRVGFASPDALTTPSNAARAAADPDTRIEPAWKCAFVYGRACAIYHIVPSAYYLAAHYSNDFENAVLHAINGGGQNLARALLTGALVGAQVGFSGIPTRFIDGLANSEAILALAKKLAEQAEQKAV